MDAGRSSRADSQLPAEHATVEAILKKRAAELVHRAGREPNRAAPKKLREKLLRSARKKYSLADERLASKDGIEVPTETLRRWMLAEGLGSLERKGLAYRSRRARSNRSGRLAQFEITVDERG